MVDSIKGKKSEKKLKFHFKKRYWRSAFPFLAYLKRRKRRALIKIARRIYFSPSFLLKKKKVFRFLQKRYRFVFFYFFRLFRAKRKQWFSEKRRIFSIDLGKKGLTEGFFFLKRRFFFSFLEKYRAFLMVLPLTWERLVQEWLLEQWEMDEYSLKKTFLKNKSLFPYFRLNTKKKINSWFFFLFEKEQKFLHSVFYPINRFYYKEKKIVYERLVYCQLVKLFKKGFKLSLNSYFYNKNRKKLLKKWLEKKSYEELKKFFLISLTLNRKKKVKNKSISLFFKGFPFFSNSPFEKKALPFFKKEDLTSFVKHWITFKVTQNNSFLTVTNPDGEVLLWHSAGCSGFRGPRRSTPYAARMAGISFFKKLMRVIKGQLQEIKKKGAGYPVVTFGVFMKKGLKKKTRMLLGGFLEMMRKSRRARRRRQVPNISIRCIIRKEPVSHNGLRKKKKRRL